MPLLVVLEVGGLLRAEHTNAAYPSTPADMLVLVTVREHNRCQSRVRRRSFPGGIPGMRMRELMRRNSDVMERQAAAFDRQAAAFDRQAETLERQGVVLEAHTRVLEEQTRTLGEQTRTLGEQTRVLQAHTRTLGHQVDQMRSASADLTLCVESFDRRTDALLGAFSDLAAEIRGWRSDHGSG
ncbi:MAG: hypothetical protein M3N56_14425 [Actinomycetota bacterium]|nr:hypothetical protein [Actinomycetota bacterium]